MSENKALLVIDMLKDFVEENSVLEVPFARKIIPNIKNKINWAKAKNIPVIYVCDSHRRNDEEFVIWPSHALEGTSGAMVIDEIAPQEGDFLVRKRRYSAFLGTDLEILLKELNIKTLFITGILTNICVFFTAAEASMRGYEVIVYSDSVASTSKEDHRFALDQMKRVLKIKVV
ncbi:cysteine hydrolase [Candidatus Aerophobetes bacterium]|nr:cysteine hydrolase [Candidatus Aerophobetes bacterium]